MTKPKEYVYLGSPDILEQLPKSTTRLQVTSSDDVRFWVKSTGQTLTKDKTLIVTFIIDTHYGLWVNDRHSEHVLCAGGLNVFSAGEMTFLIQDDALSVVDVTNQSTGYCPEPESWWVVAIVLDKVNISHPQSFTTEFLFRFCSQCHNLNIVKDGWFECELCQAPLSQHWNIDEIFRGRN